jgi:hypothetical protein
MIRTLHRSATVRPARVRVSAAQRGLAGPPRPRYTSSLIGLLVSQPRPLLTCYNGPVVSRPLDWLSLARAEFAVLGIIRISLLIVGVRASTKAFLCRNHLPG